VSTITPSPRRPLTFAEPPQGGRRPEMTENHVPGILLDAEDAYPAKLEVPELQVPITPAATIKARHSLEQQANEQTVPALRARLRLCWLRYYTGPPINRSSAASCPPPHVSPNWHPNQRDCGFAANYRVLLSHRRMAQEDAVCGD
jgi:hypothetical protein